MGVCDSTAGAVPINPADVAPDEGAHARLEALYRNISPVLAVPGLDGAYVATGHSVWGMLNAPATGEAMSELILDGGAQRVDLAPFAPARLPPLEPARRHGASG